MYVYLKKEKLMNNPKVGDTAVAHIQVVYEECPFMPGEFKWGIPLEHIPYRICESAPGVLAIVKENECIVDYNQLSIQFNEALSAAKERYPDSITALEWLATASGFTSKEPTVKATQWADQIVDILITENQKE
jgi:hypothetical protein